MHTIPYTRFGIPDGYSYRYTQYAPAVNAVIAGFARNARPRVGRLFFRAHGDELFRAFPVGDDKESHESCRCSASTEWVYYLTDECRELGNEDSRWWISLNRYSPLADKAEVLIEKNGLQLLTACDRPWIADIVSIAADDESLDLRVGLDTPTETGYRMDYFIMRFDLKRQTMTSRMKLLGARL